VSTNPIILGLTKHHVLFFLVGMTGMRCVELHSQMNQPMRERMLTEFRSGKTRIMLATDIAARGIHVQNVEYVINYDFPDTLEQVCYACKSSFFLGRL
jgi:superfamily II DNA/RNA helicase